MRYSKFGFVLGLLALVGTGGNVALAAALPAKSPLNNGSLSLVGLESEVGDSTTVTARLISEGGANANNVRVELELRDASGQVKDELVVPGVDILHENPKEFTLRAQDLPAGSYTPAVVVINNSDSLLNAAFENNPAIRVGEAAAASEPVSSPVVASPAPAQAPSAPAVPVTEEKVVTELVSANSSNPLSGKKFYVDPYNDASRQASEWRSSRPGDASQMDKIAKVATARWMGDWNANIAGDVRQTMDAASRDGSYPVFVIYNIPKRDCGGYSAGGSNNPDGYKAWIRDFASGLDGRSAAVVLEPDALSLTDCLSDTDKNTRFELMRYAVDTLTASGAQVYLDAGHPNWIPASEMASRLKKAGIEKAQGFALNTSNFYSTEENIRYGEEISRAVGNKHFIIDTSRNGNGSNGEWCNPSDRALGTPSTANTGNSLVDAFYWLKPPGQSDGNCNGGPSAGVWWPNYALGLARRAN